MSESVRRPSFYNSVWRWHFYAGMFCIPFVIWLALTGSLYLWRPQIEAWLDRPYAHLAGSGPLASPDALVAAAEKAVPGSRLARYQLPGAPDAAVQILVARDGVQSRAYVDPHSARVLNVVTESKRLMKMVSSLHGELMIGAIGSYLVEIAACWAIVMLLTGLYLWWPRTACGLGGVLYPRLGRGSRLFWRDIHATTGIWVSLFALLLILTGLPWAKGWGTYLAEVRAVTGAVKGPVDWTIGGKPPAADAGESEHAGHEGMAGMAGMPGMAMPMPSAVRQPGDLARVIAATAPTGIAAPVMIAPPARAGTPWSISSDAADRPLRAEMKVEGATGRIVSRSGFDQKHWIDRVVGYGIAVHEGALFGILNQLIGTVTALLLVLLAISGAVMWWRRRPVGLLGAPVPLTRPTFGPVLVAAIVALGLYMPMFGGTLVAVLIVERLVLRNLPGPRRWLGLRASA